ncbi:hypothetical protein QYE76_031653 [Lolium multiflorum]|uniref:Uncharacterized protein n=1 Tax=Lolium multiflorum TaxID=4521 RepID=A0AAD8QS27_LOLMU|nr:hypothetical protein QYE76_031653 [Lolium multiflorum]
MTVRSHNVTVLVFWSPFLVNGMEKSSSPGAGGLDHYRIYFDQPGERWASEVRARFIRLVCLAVKNALREVIARTSAGRQKLSVLTTFSSAHFAGEWDSPARTQPYGPREDEMARGHRYVADGGGGGRGGCRQGQGPRRSAVETRFTVGEEVVGARGGETAAPVLLCG